ncbi:hypothetical protein LINGRAHAP2_LOCUS12935 [Linum grandiflorum]
MENSMGVGLMAAFAVSGSVVLISTQFHKRLLNNFMDKIESELGGRRRIRRSNIHGKKQRKMKRVRFAEDVTQLSPISDDLYYEEDEYEDEDLGGMPVNRQILYKGIMEYRNMKDYHISTCI